MTAAEEVGGPEPEGKAVSSWEPKRGGDPDASPGVLSISSSSDFIPIFSLPSRNFCRCAALFMPHRFNSYMCAHKKYNQYGYNLLQQLYTLNFDIIIV